MKLIATLPPVYREELLHQIASHPDISELRYNTGILSHLPVEETVRMLKVVSDHYHKPLWIDLKGRQLRVTRWAFPDYGKVEVNHNVSVDGDAFVCFRDGDKVRLKFASGNVLYLDPPPRQAVGQGQSLVVLGDGVTIDGYLTGADKQYIEAAALCGHNRFLLSFVEQGQDVIDVHTEYMCARTRAKLPHQQLELGLKIESPRGFDVVASLTSHQMPITRYRLMAARDDLFTTMNNDGKRVIEAMRTIIKADPSAILASRIMSGIEHNGQTTLSDATDIECARHMGYTNFMLSDGICHRHFAKAMETWRALIS